MSAEQHWLRQELRCLFGYHLMTLSSAPADSLDIDSPINHSFRLSPSPECSDACQAVTDYEQLPLPDESIDVSILHHVLEYAVNPQQVLKEAARVTIANGYIVLLTFNPVSMLGLISRLGRSFTGVPQFQRRGLASQRLRDWLKFVDCTYTPNHYLAHRLPISSQRFVSLSRVKPKWLDSRQLPFGAVYAIIARKDRVAMRPIAPVKEKKFLLDAVPVPVRGMAVGRSQSMIRQSEAVIIKWPGPLRSNAKVLESN